MVLHSRFLPSAAKPDHTVVLLHAFPLSSVMWERMAQELQSLRDDTALLLIDFPGFGESPEREKWNLATLPVELRGIIERHTRKPVTIAGLSLGGYAVFEFFRMNPDLVRGLVLSNTRAEADSEEERRGRATFAEDALARGPEAAIDRLYSNFVTPETEPEIAIDIRNWIMEAKPPAIAACLNAMAERDDSRSVLPLITIPSLVISGERDVMMRTTNMRAMASALEDSSFVEIKSAAHLTAVERPREWAEALASFLDRL
jgi:3-oxoadipate enol-lactonase